MFPPEDGYCLAALVLFACFVTTAQRLCRWLTLTAQAKVMERDHWCIAFIVTRNSSTTHIHTQFQVLSHSKYICSNFQLFKCLYTLHCTPHINLKQMKKLVITPMSTSVLWRNEMTIWHFPQSKARFWSIQVHMSKGQHHVGHTTCTASPNGWTLYTTCHLECTSTTQPSDRTQTKSSWSTTVNNRVVPCSTKR